MPWRTTNMSDQRQEFVSRILAGGASFSAVCREFGISRKTGYKWKTRALQDGVSELAERSRRPLRSAAQLDEVTTCTLIRLKLAHPTWGPKKICALHLRLHHKGPSLSTCHRVLQRAGLVAARRRRVRPSTGRLQVSICAAAPNDVWTVDFKGWWRVADRQRCEPLTVRDAYSRYVLAVRVVPRADTATIQSEFVRLFETYGLPKVIKSDNGVPFAATASVLGLSRLSAWWTALGIDLDRSRPAHPQDNGAHERLHRDLHAELAQFIQPNLVAQQAACELWRESFNHERPHEALGQRRPSDLYSKSPRLYRPAALAYPTGFVTRKVRPVGSINWLGNTLFISTALAGWDVGLQQHDASTLQVYFAHLHLGHIDLQTLRFHAAPSRVVEAHRLSA